MVITRVQPKAAISSSHHSPTRPICQQLKAGKRLDRPRVVVDSPPPTDFRAFVRSFQLNILLLSRLVRPFLTRRSISCSIIGGGGRGAPLRHLPRLSAPDKTIRQSVNQSIRFFQKPVSRSPLEIHSPFRAAGQETSPFPDCQTVTQLCKRGQNIHTRSIDQFLTSLP